MIVVMNKDCAEGEVTGVMPRVEERTVVGVIGHGLGPAHAPLAPARLEGLVTGARAVGLAVGRTV